MIKSMWLRAMLIVLFWALALSGTNAPAQAASPPSGTLAPTVGTSISWSGTATGGASVDESTCIEQVNCDTFTLTLSGVPSDWTGKQVRVLITWLSPTTDYDLYVHKGTINDPVYRDSGQGLTNFEVVVLDPSAAGTGNYAVHVVYFLANAADQYRGKATVETSTAPPPPPPGTGIVPRYQNYAAPGGLGTNSGEPSIGADWLTSNIMFQAILQTLRVSFDDCSSPAVSTWLDRSPPTSATSLDPILFTDHDVGPCRTIVSQLVGTQSLSSFTDNDGDSWTPSQGSGIGSGVDHQTIGGGPYAPGFGLPAPGQAYTHAVYYCSQDIGDALCARSDTGGLSYGPAIPIYTAVQCGGLHGHVKVAPNDGTVYVPNKGCGGRQAVVVSTDNGTTWSVRTVPDSTAGRWDPSLGLGVNGTLYFGYGDQNNRAMVTVSRDRGQTWSASVDVGAPFGNKDTAFPAVVAGDDNRAAFAFLGTTTVGGGTEVWHLYIAHTFDGGATWLVADATPNDPVQRGTICSGGISCGSDRNLLDFMDATVDRFGRTLVGYADGCTGPCVNDPNQVTRSALATIARQSGGRRLFARYDPPEPSVPAAPLVSGTVDAGGVVQLTWQEPDNGGSPISGYKIYRRTTASGETLLASVGNVLKYVDTTTKRGTTYFYRVTAVNAVGEGPSCRELSSTTFGGPESPCALPGITILADRTGDALDAQPSHDIQRISVAEPASFGPNKLAFVIKMASLSSIPPDTRWPVQFKAPDNKGYSVDMRSDPTSPTGVRFKYGTFTINADGSYGSPNTVVGDAHPSSRYTADGTITIVMTNTLIGNPQVGQSLTGFLMRVRVEGQLVALTPDNAPDNLSPTGSYTLVGNSACPTAVELSSFSTRGEELLHNELALLGLMLVSAVTLAAGGVWVWRRWPR